MSHAGKWGCGCVGAGNLLEVMELDFQSESVAFKMVLAQGADKFLGSMVELDGDGCIFVNVLFEGGFTSYRFADVGILHRTLINATGKIIEHNAHLANLFL